MLVKNPPVQYSLLFLSLADQLRFIGSSRGHTFDGSLPGASVEATPPER